MRFSPASIPVGARLYRGLVVDVWVAETEEAAYVSVARLGALIYMLEQVIDEFAAVGTCASGTARREPLKVRRHPAPSETLR